MLDRTLSGLSASLHCSTAPIEELVNVPLATPCCQLYWAHNEGSSEQIWNPGFAHCGLSCRENSWPPSSWFVFLRPQTISSGSFILLITHRVFIEHLLGTSFSAGHETNKVQSLTSWNERFVRETDPKRAKCDPI